MCRTVINRTISSAQFLRWPTAPHNTTKWYRTHFVPRRTHNFCFLQFSLWIRIGNDAGVECKYVGGDKLSEISLTHAMLQQLQKRCSTPLAPIKTNNCHFLWSQQWMRLVNMQELCGKMTNGTSSARTRWPIRRGDNTKRYSVQLAPLRTHNCCFPQSLLWIRLVNLHELCVNMFEGTSSWWYRWPIRC